MFAWLTRTFWILLGFLLVGLLIWYVGPMVAFAGRVPLASINARLIAIGVVLGGWVLVRLTKRLRAFRASDRLVRAVIAQPQPEPARVPSDVAKLRERFEEGVAALKQQRRSGHSLYELPWYVIIGAPGSGKTTALLNSGLKLPLEQRGGKAALRGVGGTRNCDWWFTDEAVFLDTAGRYTTQDSDPGSDSAGWSEFLALLRRYRERRPVNGVILTINAQDLLAQGASVRESHVEAARYRLDELSRELRIQLPVYVMVTKCDLIAGFVEYFEDLTSEERSQVWGVTFPYEQTLANDAPRAFPGEMEALVTRLNERVFTRLNDVRDVRRRAKVFAFPQQMAALRDSLAQFVTDVFDVSQFDRQVLLRGVYFTSGTQLGTPIDRLLGSLGRRFGASDAMPVPTGPAKAYFVQRLLKDVLIAESGLAGINRRLEARKAAVQLGAYAATGLVAASGVAALSFGYARNRAYLERTATEIAALERVPEVTPSSSPDRMVARFDAIKGIVDSSARYRDSTFVLMRWGLYQARAIGAAAEDAYRRELDSVLLPQFGARMAAGIRASGRDAERLSDYTRAYMMLLRPEHATREFLEERADAEWQGAGAAGPVLAQHFHALLESSRTLRPLPLDTTLASQALNGLWPWRARIIYHRVKAKYSEGPGVPLDSVGLDIDKVFKRANGVPLATPIPAIYTKPVFKRFAKDGLAEVKRELDADTWMWGETEAAASGRATALLADVVGLYERDYERAWEEVMNDLELVDISSVSQVKEVLRILTTPASPLRGVLQLVGSNTALVDAPPAPGGSGGLLGNVAEQAAKAKERLGNLATGATGRTPVEPGRAVTARFQSLRDLTAGEPDKSRLAEIELLLAQVLGQLELLGPDVAGAEPVQILASPQFRNLVESLRQRASTLPYSLKDIVSQLAGLSETRVNLALTRDTQARYQQQVVQPCQTLIANRYPFASTDAREVQLRDFTAVFGPGGTFDRFFKDHLEAQVDTSGPVWTWRPGAVQMLTSVLDQFQAALRLRNLFFADEGKGPLLEFLVTPSALEGDATRFILELDGQRIDYKRETPAARSLKWPGPSPGVLVSFDDPRHRVDGVSYGGPWGWLKLIDKTMSGEPDAQQRIRLNVTQGTRRVTLTVETPGAGLMPFGTWSWRQFRCEA